MEYINKATHSLPGNIIIDELLDKCWILAQSRYVNADYENGLKADRARKIALVNLLLENQANLCCYCMKVIQADDTTLEHIIPDSTNSQDKFDEYNGTPELDDNVIWDKSFDRKTKTIPPAEYPHDIAYYNLVASCDSDEHCNHFRGSTFIKPLFYDVDVKEKVIYDKQGRGGSDNYTAELNTLGLSGNEDLRIFRKLWGKLAENFDTVEDVGEDDVKSLVYDMIGEASFNRKLENFAGQPSQREVLMKYKWFFDYYKS